MPNLLAVDASSSFCSVAISIDGHTQHLVEQQPRRQAQRLLPMVDELLAEVGIRPKQIDGIAFGRGPGSFTGLRIAASVAQGIATGLDIPICGVSSLQTLAHAEALNTQESYTAICLMNAHMGELFWAAYHVESGQSQLRLDEQVGKPELCLSQINNLEGKLVGNGLLLPECSDLAQDFSAIEPQADMMMPLVIQAWNNGEFGEPADHPPVYLRKSVAWKKLDEQPKLLKG